MEGAGAGDDPLETSERTAQLPGDEVPSIAPLAHVAAGLPRAVTLPPSDHASLSLTTAAGAMRNEEVERTRLFIRMGWLLSVAAMATVPFVDAPRTLSIM